MEVKGYLLKMQRIEEILIDFLDNERNEEKDSHVLNFNYFEGLNFKDKKYRLKEILHLIVQISNNHHRSPDFYLKICTVINYFKEDIKQSFSNYEIFTIFSRNKRILSFLFKERILTNASQFVEHFKDESYQFYFAPEIASIENRNQKLFEYNRNLGENESLICQIIRRDSVEEFHSYVSVNNISLFETKIQPSIFETNEFLIDKQPSLIEYAAFFGSIRIIHYLQSQKVKLTPSVWLYAIHANNQEMIHFLENNRVKPADRSYEECYEESIRCHHNYIANYIKNNLFKKNRKILAKIIPYFNYAFFQDDCNDYLHEFIENDYVELVSILLKSTKIDINYKKIS
ncbi:hypothetical protein M9Y10_043654 [Tritrichomonas musculus]|uniref:DUF3447 domain-containing protein n=1 Tax=Tritrichomonas musculus TaxID=1915356 RepID=A0ABR2K380_9EUKA